MNVRKRVIAVMLGFALILGVVGSGVVLAQQNTPTAPAPIHTTQVQTQSQAQVGRQAQVEDGKPDAAETPEGAEAPEAKEAEVPGGPDTGVQQPSYTGSITVDQKAMEGMSEADEAAALQSKAKITAKDAEAAALAANPGTTVVKTELDNENGVLVYSVELSNGLDVKVDAGNGKILHTEQGGPDQGMHEQEGVED